MKNISPDDIDQLLPQTQCGLCGYNGCMPYAEAMAYEHAAINLCPPGGVPTLQALGALLDQDPAPYIEAMAKQTKPRMVAVIREAECIGCTKCIPACPVDAIIGSAKQMHAIITDECTGCELCVEPCPMDCIDMITLTDDDNLSDQVNLKSKNLSRHRFNAKSLRTAKDIAAKKLLKQDKSITEKRNYVLEAVARAKAKKNIT